jgi:alpha-amylase
MFSKLSLCAAATLGVVEAADKDAWRSRAVYQVLTDRFAKEGGGGACGDLSNYCGGTYKGMIEHLDYIEGMGFDAIWISPVVDNWANGYHGYWA